MIKKRTWLFASKQSKTFLRKTETIGDDLYFKKTKFENKES